MLPLLLLLLLMLLMLPAVLPAIPLFGLKKGLLGPTHPLFAGVLSGAADAVAAGAATSAAGQCQGPVCALLPMLAKLNLTLADVQVRLCSVCVCVWGGGCNPVGWGSPTVG